MESSDLLKKYDVPVPRYTSYPTVPFWDNSVNVQQWKRIFKNQFYWRMKGKDSVCMFIFPFANLCVPIVDAIKKLRQTIAWRMHISGH